MNSVIELFYRRPYMHIKIDDLSSPAVIALLQEHLDDMYATSPAESVHALDLNELKKSNITFFSAWRDDTLLGCIAIKQLCPNHAEIKSMRTAKHARGSGVASRLLQHTIELAIDKAYLSLSLETGTQDYFYAARNLYLKFGFNICGPFADYQEDPHSTFMTLQLNTVA